MALLLTHQNFLNDLKLWIFRYLTSEPKHITIEGLKTTEPDKPAQNLAPKDFPEEKCPLASRGISVTPKDVLILMQFCKKDGTMLTQEQTGLCDRQFVVVREALTIAQNDGLMPYRKIVKTFSLGL